MRIVWSIIGVCLLPQVVLADRPKVKIEGGPDITGHNYVWQVTNLSRSPIVAIEFPHWHADMFHGSDGWSSKSTYLVNVGVPDLPGVCVATADSPDHYIRFDSSAEFFMRVSPKGADRGTADVKVRFEDGTVTIVPNVQLPTAPPEDPYKHAPMIALLVLFLGWIGLRTWRQRRRNRQGPRPEENG